MSGGFFDYKQYTISDIADQVEHLIESNDSKAKDPWGDAIGRNYPPEVIDQFKTGLTALRQAQVYVHRIDYLVSGDDGEESFLRCLNRDLAELHRTNKSEGS